MTVTGPSSALVWVEADVDHDAAARISAAVGCPVWVAELLAGRGIRSPEDAARWLTPRLKELGDPFLLPDMDRAVDRLLAAITARERITIFGDYDVDGLTSVALTEEVLRGSGAPVSVFLPYRMEEGYGLSPAALERCIGETRPQLIVTVDCGTGSVEAVQAAARQGIDVIITDHHAVGDTIAPAAAVVNPRRSSDERLHVLAGVGVAFKLAHALLKKARATMGDQPWTQFDPRQSLDLVALGTVADLVPLREENRVLVHHGLKQLNGTRRVGLQALRAVAGIDKEIDTYEVGYLLGPRLNAAGRLGTAQVALALLMTGDPARASAWAGELDAANRERQQVERAIVDMLTERVDAAMQAQPAYSVVEADESWHPGVVGIVASRMVQRHHRPAIIIGLDDQGRAKGSCRSIPGFNMVEALDVCREHLVKHGGHAMAAGVEVSWDRIPDFQRAFEAEACRRLEGQVLQRSLALEGWLSGASIDDEMIRWLDQLRPFGMGHAEPTFGMRGVSFAGVPREVGKGHLKARLVCHGVEMEAIGFGLYSRARPTGPVDVAFHLRREVYRGRESRVVHLKDFRPSRPG